MGSQVEGEEEIQTKEYNFADETLKMVLSGDIKKPDKYQKTKKKVGQNFLVEASSDGQIYLMKKYDLSLLG